MIWQDVRPLIEEALQALDGVDVFVYEPTSRYQNVSKRSGVEKRALVVELLRRYWAFLTTPEAKVYRSALETTARTIDGFESPHGMELLTTVDWLLHHGLAKSSVSSVKAALRAWPGGDGAGERKLRLFDDRLLELALRPLTPQRPEQAQFA